jgi:hypothetical protein
MLFKSRLCNVCTTALYLAFDSMTGRESDEIPHHLTKESLVDSVLHRSCHLCRFIIFHLKTHWAIEHLEGKDDLKEEPTSLTESDFADSDFDHKAFPSDRLVVLSYMLDMPENLNFHVKMSKSGDWFDGVFGLVEFDCDALNHDYIKAAIPRFWIFNDKGASDSLHNIHNTFLTSLA